MKYVWLEAAVLIILFLHLPSFCFSQDAQIVSNIGTAQGLSNFTAKAIYQDRQGLVWIGTNDGLNSFDGRSFTIYRHRPKDSTSIAGNWVTGISEDSSGHLWVATRDGVSIFEKVTGVFKHTKIPDNGVNKPLHYVTDIIALGSDVYASTESTGLVAFFNLNNIGVRIPLEKEGHLDYNYRAHYITKDGTGNLWALVEQFGLCLFDKEKHCLVLREASIKIANCMEGVGEKLLLGDTAGVTEYNIATRVIQRLCNKTISGNKGERIMSIKEDKDHNLWLAFNYKGLFILEPGSKIMRPVNATPPFDNSIESVYCLEMDNKGRMWAGTIKKGIYLFDPNRNDFGTYGYQVASNKALSDHVVFSLVEDKDSLLWIGTDGNGLHQWNRKTGGFDSYSATPGAEGHLKGNAICDITCGSNGDLWLANSINGVARYNTRYKTFKQYECYNPVSGKNNSAFSTANTSDGNVWVGTLRNNEGLGALYKYQPKQDKFDVFDPALSDLMVLKQFPDGSFWGGNLHEVVRIDETLARSHRHFEIGSIVRSLCEAEPGSIWVGTEGSGLLLLDLVSGRIVKQYTTADGLCNDAVLNILKDQSGRLWLGTAYGLACFSPGKQTFVNYYKEDGLASNQFSFHAARQLADGRMVFGCAQGLIMFNPLLIHPPQIPATPVLTTIRVAGQSLLKSAASWKPGLREESGNLELPFESASLVIDYTAPEFTSPGQLRYSYYLDGWDNDWNDAGSRQTVAYSSLREGRYRLRIKARTVSGEWGEEMPPLLITILPPWYRSWWAYSIYIISLLLAVYSYVNYRSRQKRLLYEIKLAKLTADNEKAEKEKRQVELELKEAEHAAEKAEREKEKVIMESERELNERRKDFFTSISHEFRTPLTLIVNPAKKLQKIDQSVEQREIFNTIYLNSKRLLSLVDQLLLFNKSESGFDKLRVSKMDLREICDEVFRCFASQAAAKNLFYLFENEEHEIPVYADKMKLEIILFNLLSNAIKFTSEKGRVTLRLEDGNGVYNIYVTDTGEGIPVELEGQLFKKFGQAALGQAAKKVGFGVGLYLARVFTEAHSGQLTFQSGEVNGTVFKLVLKKGINHFQPSEIIPDSGDVESFVNELFADAGEIKNSELPDTCRVEELLSPKHVLLIIDDDESMVRYLADLFKVNYRVLKAEDGTAGLEIARANGPDLIISDVHMGGMSGIDLCSAIKEAPETAHIPVILLTGSYSDALRLEGVEGGADDYFTKPFDADLLVARVASIIKGRKGLQQYFLNEVTFQKTDFKVSGEYRQFLETCIDVVGRHLDDEAFEIKGFAKEMGMSYSTLYNRIKAISGLSVNAFIRYLRLRKAAEMLVTTDMRVNQVAFSTGFNHLPYFRKCFLQLFGMTASEYVKKYRNRLGDSFSINKN